MQIKKAELAVKQVVTKMESAPGGIIDIVTKVFAKNAQINKQKSENRVRVEATVNTDATATEQALKNTRSSLQAGFKTTSDLSADEYKKELERAAAAAIIDVGNISVAQKK